MESPQRSIFRDHALRHYVRKRQKDVLPRLIAPAILVILWLVLTILLAMLVIMLPGLPGFFGG